MRHGSDDADGRRKAKRKPSGHRSKQSEATRQRFLMHPGARATASAKFEERVAAEMPDWMRDPALLPKKPPGRM